MDATIAVHPQGGRFSCRAVVLVPQLMAVEKTVEIPQLQIVEKIIEIPEIQTVQDTLTFERFGTAPVRQVAPAEIVEALEIGAPLSAESASPFFVTAHVLVSPFVMEQVEPAPVVEYENLAPVVMVSVSVTTVTAAPTVFPTATVPIATEMVHSTKTSGSLGTAPVCQETPAATVEGFRDRRASSRPPKFVTAGFSSCCGIRATRSPLWSGVVHAPVVTYALAAPVVKASVTTMTAAPTVFPTTDMSGLITELINRSSDASHKSYFDDELAKVSPKEDLQPRWRRTFACLKQQLQSPAYWTVRLRVAGGSWYSFSTATDDGGDACR